jgi:hypothetical protein
MRIGLRARQEGYGFRRADQWRLGRLQPLRFARPASTHLALTQRTSAAQRCGLIFAISARVKLVPFPIRALPT